MRQVRLGFRLALNRWQCATKRTSPKPRPEPTFLGCSDARREQNWFAFRPAAGPGLSPSPERNRYPVQFYSFEIVIEKEAEDEGYYAWSPSLPGCFSNGRTIEDAKRNMRTAVTQHVTALLARGEAIPQNERLVHVEELAIGIP